MINWKDLTEIEQIQKIVADSEHFPQMIFKHSTRCSISSTAKTRLERNWSYEEGSGPVPWYVDVIDSRPISNEIAGFFGIDHESPQVLLIDNGNCYYNNSHLGISFKEIVEQVSSLEEK